MGEFIHMAKKKNTEAYQYPEMYSKSNFLIGAKYRSTLLENKLMALSLSRIQYNKEKNELFAKIKASEIRRLLNTNTGSFYTQLDDTAKMMTGKSIGISDAEKQEFCYIAVVTKAEYKNSELYVQFHSDLKKYLYNIKDKFTPLQLSIMLSFKNVYSFRLYEILKSKSFYPKWEKRNDNLFRFEISLSELKLELGIVNSELDEVRRVLRNSTNPDYDKAVEKSPEVMFSTWYDFRRYVVDKAIKEINEKTDMYVEYKSLTGGRGGKVYALEFTVQLLKDNDGDAEENVEKTEITEDYVLECAGQVYLLSNGQIKMTDCKKICEKAQYDMNKVQKAFEVMKKAKGVENPVGFMIKAIEENWEKMDKKNNSWNNKDLDVAYNQMDFDAFEKEILAN